MPRVTVIAMIDEVSKKEEFEKECITKVIAYPATLADLELMKKEYLSN